MVPVIILIQQTTGEKFMSKVSSADLMAISAAAGELILACSGEHPDISQDNTGKMCSLWDNFNDVLAPPDVVKAMADEILSTRKRGAR